jgi:hypothetical protein
MTKVHIGKKSIYDSDIRVIDNENNEDHMNIDLGTAVMGGRACVAFELDIEQEGYVTSISLEYPAFNILVNGLIAMRNDMKKLEMEALISK